MTSLRNEFAALMFCIVTIVTFMSAVGIVLGVASHGFSSAVVWHSLTTIGIYQ